MNNPRENEEEKQTKEQIQMKIFEEMNASNKNIFLHVEFGKKEYKWKIIECMWFKDQVMIYDWTRKSNKNFWSSSVGIWKIVAIWEHNPSWLWVKDLVKDLKTGRIWVLLVINDNFKLDNPLVPDISQMEFVWEAGFVYLDDEWIVNVQRINKTNRQFATITIKTNWEIKNTLLWNENPQEKLLIDMINELSAMEMDPQKQAFLWKLLENTVKIVQETQEIVMNNTDYQIIEEVWLIVDNEKLIEELKKRWASESFIKLMERIGKIKKDPEMMVLLVNDYEECKKILLQDL